MLDQLDLCVSRKALVRLPEHDRGEVDPDALHLGTIHSQQPQQPPIARPEIEDAASVLGDLFEQNALSLRAARILIRSLEIAHRVL